MLIEWDQIVFEWINLGLSSSFLDHLPFDDDDEEMRAGGGSGDVDAESGKGSQGRGRGGEGIHRFSSYIDTTVPRIHTNMSSNVEAWSACRLIMGNFGARFKYRVDLYLSKS